MKKKMKSVVEMSDLMNKGLGLMAGQTWMQ